MTWSEATFLAWFSVGVTMVAFGSEFNRLFWDSTGLVRRLEAFNDHDVPAFDLPYTDCWHYWIPATTLSSDPGGIAFGELFHCINILFMFAIAGSEIPNVKWLISKWDPWMQVFGKDTSTWYAGALQLWLGMMFLGAPTAHPLTDNQTKWLRYMTGWLLIAIAFVNFLFAMTAKSAIRFRRGQVAKPGAAPDHAGDAKRAWRAWRTVIETTYADHMAVGPMRDALANMDEAMAKL